MTSPVGPGSLPPSFLFVTQYFPPERGAAQVRLGAVTREVSERGHRVEVLTAIPNYPTGRFLPGWSRRPLQRRDEGGVRVTRVWVWPAVGSGLARVANFVSFGVASMFGLASVRRADWTVVEYPTLFGAVPAVAWCRLRRRRVVVNVADLWVDVSVAVGSVSAGGRAVAVLRRIERWMLRSADVVTVVTEGLRDAVVDKGVDPARVRWMPNGVDVQLFDRGPGTAATRSRYGVGDDEHLVVYAGTHGYVHGLEVVLAAAEELASLPIRFVLVGGGSEKDRLVAEATRRGLARVSFHDPVAPEEVAELLRCAVAGLACTRRGEAYRAIRSAKMLPVMSTATPVLYSGDDEGAAIVAETGAGRALPAGDAGALAEAIRWVVDHPEEAGAMGERGRAYVEEHASWTTVVGRWLSELAGSGPTGVGEEGQ